MRNDADIQGCIWGELYRKVVALLQQYGKEEPTGEGDFWVVDDNYGWRRHTVNVFDLKMLDPAIIARLQKLLSNLPDWEIVLALDVPGKESDWPRMGVTIRRQEIIDGLARSVLPEHIGPWLSPGAGRGPETTEVCAPPATELASSNSRASGTIECCRSPGSGDEIDLPKSASLRRFR